MSELPHEIAVGLTDALCGLARANELLGWHASTPFEEGLRNTIDWFLDNRAEAERAAA